MSVKDGGCVPVVQAFGSVHVAGGRPGRWGCRRRGGCRAQAGVLVVAGRWLGMVHVTPRHVNQITPMRGCWTSHAGRRGGGPHTRVTKADFSWRYPRPPTMSVPESRTWRRPGDEHRRDQGAGRGHVRRRSPTEHSDRSLTPRRSVRNGIVRGGPTAADTRLLLAVIERAQNLVAVSDYDSGRPLYLNPAGGVALMGLTDDGAVGGARRRRSSSPMWGVVQAPEMEAALPRGADGRADPMGVVSTPRGLRSRDSGQTHRVRRMAD